MQLMFRYCNVLHLEPMTKKVVKVNINSLKITTLRTVHERCFSVFATNFENFVTWMRIVNTLNLPESKYLLNKKDTMMISMTVFLMSLLLM